MRFLLRATIPVEVGNDMVHDPDMGKKMDQIMGDIKPEAAYFCLEGGRRTVYMVVSVEESHQLPAICEPLWNAWEADVELIPAMTQEDFAKAAPAIEQVIKNY